MLASTPRTGAHRAAGTASIHAVAPHVPRRAATACRAASGGAASNPLLVGLIEALFRFPPFFQAASRNARAMIVKRGEALGLPWKTAMERMQAQDWASAIEAVRNPAVKYPAYYTSPFHAYPEGNLCWEAALELTLAAKSVHAPVMDPAGKELDSAGDEKMRASYGRNMKEMMAAQGARPVRDIVDLGCATGLSSLALAKEFPEASVTGIDASPHFLAVGRYEQQQRQASEGASERIRYQHGLAEDTQLPSESCDLVSICLVCHELPQAATRDIFNEAYRLLRPGGCLSVMEMDPTSPTFQRICSNPFVFTAFKSTEPFLQEYVALDMPGEMEAAGFKRPLTASNTPRHKTVVAVKP